MILNPYAEKSKELSEEEKVKLFSDMVSTVKVDENMTFQLKDENTLLVKKNDLENKY